MTSATHTPGPWRVGDSESVRDELLAHLRGMVAMVGQSRRDAGWPFAGMHDALLQHGRFWTATRLPRGVRRGTPKECFHNALKLAAMNRDLTYVEGICAAMIPVHHAFVVDPEGRVIDTTWDEPERCVYHGIPVQREFLSRFIAEHEYWASLLDDPRHGWPFLSGRVTVEDVVDARFPLEGAQA